MEGMINIKYPKFLADYLQLNSEEFEMEIKINSLVKLFESGRISSGTAARVLGITRIEFMELLAKYKIPVYAQENPEELKKDILNLIS